MEALKHKKTFALAVFFSIFLVGLAKGFYKEYKKSEEATQNILSVLKENCDCKEVTQSMFSKGIQFSKKDGISNVKAQYQLTDCKYTNLKEEVKRIEKLLLDNVCYIESFDLLTLDFVNDNNHNTIKLKTHENAK